MSSEVIAALREVHDLLTTFDEPSRIRRAADELEGAADKVVACAAELVDVPEPENLQLRLSFAVKAIRAAEKAARAHRRNPLTRPLSHARFALNTGKARGWLQGILEKLDAAPTPPSGA
ncbi:hypothetical protein [Streptomyces botrytidirepellens]|uniref:Uncharacterized protein n=1 Tax=Streptomyces botrytidirepellens TaxID=2486417 RepID=A0A3M8VN03_9ACTN|nr:hypothetical protein [Streptomyces botrytidirepellens]RNG17815.1 hypothetical protein EEJ42_29255 [Streptomyces botrytidirepellens]